MNVNLNSHSSIQQPDTPNEHQPMEEPRYNLRQRSAQQLEPGFYTRLNSQGFGSQAASRFQSPSEHLSLAFVSHRNSESPSLDLHPRSGASLANVPEALSEELHIPHYPAFLDIDSHGNMVEEPELVDSDPNADSNSFEVRMNRAQQVGETGFRPDPENMSQAVIGTLALVPNNVNPTQDEANFIQSITELSQRVQLAPVAQYENLKVSTHELLDDMIEFNRSNRGPMNDEIFRLANEALRMIHGFLRTQAPRG